MINKQSAIAKAQQAANRAGCSMLVLNVNPYSPLYIIRDYDERLLYSEKLVAVVEPVLS